MKKIPVLVALAAALALTSLSHGRAEKSMVGQPLPELKLDYLTTTPVTTGNPMIVEFWATWCPPCVKGIPHLNELYSKYKAEGLVIIGVSKEDKSTVSKFLKKTPMQYFPALDPGGKFGKQFAITGIPHAVLVDRSGTIIWEGHPAQLSDRHIAKVLK